MPSHLCRVRVCLPRALFRRVAARAIEDRTDVGAVILRAVLADLPAPRRRSGGKSRPGRGH